MARKPSEKSYHHGDLRRALLDAGEVELAEQGLAKFSLRHVAARVGVSHTAPAHHFGDAAGLIDALAERGFQRLLDCMRERQKTAPQTPYERLMASGLGYLEFAVSHPALFQLVFNRPANPCPNPQVMAVAGAAFMHLATDVAALHGAAPLAHPGAHAEVLACWTRAHGFAELILSGFIDVPGSDASDGGRAERDAMFRAIFEASFLRDLPAGPP